MKLVLGTMNFGPQLDIEASEDMVKAFLKTGNHELDTAYVYNSGDTEKYLATILPEVSNYKIATKIHPRITGKLDRETIIMEFNESLHRMNRDNVDLLYFHFPDGKTPIDEALETINELHQQGKIKEFGLSNYPSWQVVDIWYKCEKNGLLKPSVYQGMYNALCRNVEPELFPSVHQLGIHFYAFNPLAGGLLSGKHLNFEAAPEPGRFARLKSYRDRYWKESYFEAIEEIRKVCNKEDIPMAEAAYRWLAFNSSLNAEKGDAIIIGASKITQMRQDIDALGKGPLPEPIINAMSSAWEIAKPDSPAYFKFF